MKKLKMTSNVKNRLKKVQDNLVYGDRNSVADEVVIQNPKRAGATVVNITAEGDTIIISDNGTGCAKPEVLFTLDVSGFGNEGFGEGFTSIYMVADYFEVRTLDWKGSLNIKEVLADDNAELEVQISNNLIYQQGFELELKGERIRECLYELVDYIQNAAALIPDMDFFINGTKVQKKSIFDVIKTSKYSQFFKNRKYEGRLYLAKTYSESYVKVYYEYRYVTEISFFGLSGSILLKPKAVNLRTPDRRDIVRDEKMWELKEKLKENAKTLIKEMIRNGDETEILLFSEIIDEYMTVDEYIPFLTMDADSILNQFEVREQSKDVKVPAISLLTQVRELDENVLKTLRNETIKEVFDEFHQNEVIENPEPEQLSFIHAGSISEEIVEENTLAVSGDVYVNSYLQKPKRDTKRIKPDKEMTSFVVGSVKDESLANKKDMEKVSIKNIGKKKNVVWVEKLLVEQYASLIAKYEYYGIYTFISPHILYHNALRHIGIPHISWLEDDAIKKDYRVTKIGARSKKEERVMEVLGFIERVLGMGESFNISTIECKMTVELRDTKIYREKLNIAGYAQGNQIHLNRKDIDFGGISSVNLGKNSLSLHDIKFVLANLDTISHESAHCLFGTEDNTKEHFEKQIEIQNKISKAVINADKIW